MIRISRNAGRLARLVLAGACAVAVSGCISLLPKTKPSLLYRFGQTPVVSAPLAAPTTGPRVGVFRANSSFQRESAGDRILTITGDRAAYVAQTRWVAPAVVLFDEALLAAFDANPGKVRLISRGEPGKSDYLLRLDVRNFETHYDQGDKAAPLIVVRLRASLTRDNNRELAGQQMFEAKIRADDNRVSAIVAAYDQAVDEALGQTVVWANATAVSAP